jgi:hypothetical protein
MPEQSVTGLAAPDYRSASSRQASSNSTPSIEVKISIQRGAASLRKIKGASSSCPDPIPGCDAYSRSPHGDRRVAGDGVGDGAPFHQRPSRLEPGHLVSAPGQSDALGPAHHAAGPVGSHDRAGTQAPQARRALVEGAGAARNPAHVRQCQRHRQRRARGQPPPHVVVALARALVAWMGAMATPVPVTSSR